MEQRFQRCAKYFAISVAALAAEVHSNHQRLGYTRRKIRGINLSFLLAGFIFAAWALVCAWTGWPRSLRHGSTAAFILFGLAAIFFCVFPLLWARRPEKHPVNHELRRYGTIREVSARLDREMSEQVETLGPFRFTTSLLVYNSGLEFQMVPYDQIVSAEIPQSNDVPAVLVWTRSGRQYEWFRSWMQGNFGPEEVVAKIREKAKLPESASTSQTTNDERPATEV